MDFAEIERIVTAGESETVEFKKTTGLLNEAGRTLCGFLNGKGGTVLVGVTPKGRILGQQVSDSTLQDVANMVRKFDPPAPIETERVRLAGSDHEILALRAAPSGETMPFTFDGRPYRRIESTTSPMPQDRYQSLLLERVHATRRWENTPVERTTIDLLDREEILRTVRLGIEAGRLPESSGDDVAEILERLGLRLEGRVLNAAVVLFGTRFLPDYPQCGLRMARFKGIDKTEFLDSRRIEGNAFTLLDEAMLFLRRHLPVSGRVQPGLFERADEPLFPVLALREALVNAFCHRDYSRAGGAVSLAIYDDRLEIWSDGGLPFGLRPDDLKRDHRSRPRNPLIAKAFYYRRLFEEWGRGTQRIVELCVKAGHPEPEFVEETDGVGVRFIPGGYTPPHRVGHDLTDRQREILHFLSTVESAALREIRSALKAPPADRTLQEDLAHLRKLELIDSDGWGRGATYRLRRGHE